METNQYSAFKVDLINGAVEEYGTKINETFRKRFKTTEILKIGNWGARFGSTYTKIGNWGWREDGKAR